MSGNGLEREIEAQIEGLGYELVDLEQVGSKARPILRIRIDREGTSPGNGVTVDECARVSRALEAYLEAAANIAERYVLEVSSPGIERPIRRRREFERFAGEPVAMKLHHAFENRGKRLEGELVGISGPEDNEVVRLKLKDGTELDVPRGEIARANLVFRWDRKG